jgi:hypothetical protein
MLLYPKIVGSRDAPDGRCIAFEKIDGTNTHWDWDRDFGWHAFGTRRDIFQLTDDGVAAFGRRHAHLKQCVEVFRDTLADSLACVFREHPAYRAFSSIRAFAEFAGPNSFAGLHQESDVKALILFEVQAEPFGFIGPQAFVADFGHLPMAKVVYQGKLTGKFANDVRRGRYGVGEGVVCKGGLGGADVWRVKIKTDAYLQRLQQAFADRWEDYWE